MTRNTKTMRRAGAHLAIAALLIAVVAAPAGAVNTCFNYTDGHVYYVAYQNSPAGPEYIVDLGDRNTFLSATTTLTFPDIRAADFSTIFSPTAPNLWMGFFGVRNPGTRDGIVSANGPKDQFQLDNSSIIGAAQQIDSWATGIHQFSNEVGGPPCHLNAANFPGKVFGSYQDTLNASFQGSLGDSVAWNVETRLSNSAGTRTATPKIRFFSATSNGQGTDSRSPIGYWKGFTDGSAQFWPDDDGDLLPDVAIGSDPEADKCPGVNDPNNTDGDTDNHAVPCDCLDTNGTVWALPTQAQNLNFTGAVLTDKATIGWAVPADSGGTAALQYDLLRANVTAPVTNPVFNCFVSNVAALTASDPATPAAGAAFFYVVRAQHACGEGTVGDGSSPNRTAPSCP